MDNAIVDLRNMLSGLDDDLKHCVGQKHGWKAAALRARKKTRVLETLFKNFRRQSIAAEKLQKKLAEEERLQRFLARRNLTRDI